MEGRACWRKLQPEDRCFHDEGREQSFNRYVPFFLRFSAFPFVRLPFRSESSQLSDFLTWFSVRLANVQDLARNDLPTTMNSSASSSFNFRVL
jgi:hypothetical protein